MTLQRETILEGIGAELNEFANLLETLQAPDLVQPTRCAGWTVGHVAGHVIGTVVDVTVGRLEGQGTAAVNERQAAERLDNSPVELAEELRAATVDLITLLQLLPLDSWQSPAPNNSTYSTAFAIEAIWYDAFVHADDIREALGLDPQRGAGLACAVHHLVGYLEKQGRSFTLELDGLEPIIVGNGGEPVTGDPLTFVLIATGRQDPEALGLGSWANVYAI
jgi:uncharacterized protein (TIGR03083 family)